MLDYNSLGAILRSLKLIATCTTESQNCCLSPVPLQCCSPRQRPHGVPPLSSRLQHSRRSNRPRGDVLSSHKLERPCELRPPSIQAMRSGGRSHRRALWKPGRSACTCPGALCSQAARRPAAWHTMAAGNGSAEWQLSCWRANQSRCAASAVLMPCLFVVSHFCCACSRLLSVCRCCLHACLKLCDTCQGVAWLVPRALNTRPGGG